MIIIRKVSPPDVLSGVRSWFDYGHHDPESIEGQSFVWIPDRGFRE